jgi:hypothetical protein
MGVGYANLRFKFLLKTISYKKKQWRPPSKKEERRKKNPQI